MIDFCGDLTHNIVKETFMKLAINKNRLDINPDRFLRQAGYGFIHDHKTGHDSYVRRLSRDFYPRLHMYFEDLPDRVIFNLHFDQKQASYQGHHMHNAEYDGPIVENEIERLKGLFREIASGSAGGFIDIAEASEDWEKQLSKDLESDGSRAPKGGDFRTEAPAGEKPKSWWRKIFG